MICQIDTAIHCRAADKLPRPGANWEAAHTTTPQHQPGAAPPTRALVVVCDDDIEWLDDQALSAFGRFTQDSVALAAPARTAG